MKTTIGIKMGGCFLLTLTVLILSSSYALNGVIGIRSSLEEIAGEAWQSADSAAKLNLNVNQSTAQLRNSLAYQEAIPAKVQQQIEQHLTTAYAALDPLRQSKYQAESQTLASTLDQLRQLKQAVIDQHSAYIAAIEASNTEHEQTRKFMQRLRFYGNFQISSLEDAFQRNQVHSWSGDVEDKWEFVIGIYTAQIELGNTAAALQRQLQSSTPGNEKAHVADALGNLSDALDEVRNSQLAKKAINNGIWQGKTYAEAITEIVKQHQQSTTHVQQTQAQFLATRDQLMRLTQTLEQHAAGLRSQIAGAVTRETESAVVRADNLSTTMLSSLPVGIILTLLAIWLSYRIVITPVKTASRQMAVIASGEGDLSVRLPVKGRDEIAELAANFNRFVSRIADTISQVSRSAGDVAQTSETLKNNSAQTLSAVEEQHHDCDQAVTAMEEISSTVNDIAGNASEAAQCSEDALTSASRSREIVERNRLATETLSAEILAATAVITQLADESSKVSNIIGVIQGIAEQTNLLALNAAIEAARAGEHGRGFAVVADEVRALSLNTQQATEEIRELLDSLQTRAGNAVSVMQKGRSMAQDNVLLSERVQSLIETVSSEIDRINQLNLLIATATEEQAQVTTITRDNLENISHATNRTADTARSNNEASRYLENQAEQLRKVLSQFKL